MSNGAESLAYFVFDTDHNHDLLAVEELAQRCGYAVISSDEVANYSDAIKIIFDNGQWRIHLDNSSAIVSVDFSDPRFYTRVNSSALQGEYVVRAVLGRKKTTQPLTVLDATAGFGHDAFLLAAAGCQVTLVEQMPLLAYLLVVRSVLIVAGILGSRDADARLISSGAADGRYVLSPCRRTHCNRVPSHPPARCICVALVISLSTLQLSH